jgi:hypothetical protein
MTIKPSALAGFTLLPALNPTRSQFYSLYSSQREGIVIDRSLQILPFLGFIPTLKNTTTLVNRTILIISSCAMTLTFDCLATAAIEK